MYTYIICQLAAQLDSSSLPKVNVANTIEYVLKLVFASMALISVIFVAFGGFKYTTANGDPQGLAKAKNTILYALVGLIVGVSSFMIVTFVLGRFA